MTGSEVSLTHDVHQHPFVFAAAFNSGDPDTVEAIYEDHGLLVTQPGSSSGGQRRRQANADLMALGVPIRVRPRHVYEYGDLALLIVDWELVGDAVDGSAVRIEGTATDVARRGPDGLWRYAIDNPWGTSHPREGSSQP